MMKKLDLRGVRAEGKRQVLHFDASVTHTLSDIQKKPHDVVYHEPAVPVPVRCRVSFHTHKNQGYRTFLPLLWGLQTWLGPWPDLVGTTAW